MNVRVGLQIKLSTEELELLTVVLKTVVSPLDCKEIKPVNPKGNQSWIFIGKTNAEAETSILQPPDRKNWFTEKYPNTGQDWMQEEKGMTEDGCMHGITDLGMSLSNLWEFLMDREAWCAAVHVITKSWTWLSDRADLPWNDGTGSHDLHFLNVAF